MPLALQALLAALPLIVAGVLLAGFRIPAKYAMPVAFLIGVIVAIFVWEVEPVNVAAASLEGVVTASGLLYIVFGALVLMAVLSATGAMQRIQGGMGSISPDRRVQAIIMVWLFGTFLEGASGFGAAAAVTAPILVAMGFPAMAAVMCALLVQTAMANFGAVGVAVIIGVNDGLRGSADVETYLEEQGISHWEMVLQLAGQIGLFHLMIGFVTPLVISIMLSYFFGREKSLWRGLELAPFALYSGVALLVPYALCAIFLGPEFPAMFGGLAGLLIVIITSRMGFLMPKKPFDFPERNSWPDRWVGTLAPDKAAPAATHMSLLGAWSPYIVVVSIIVITRLVPWVNEVMTSEGLPTTVAFDNILGTPISTDEQYLYSPGTILLIGAAVGLLVQRLPARRVVKSVKTAGLQVAAAAMALICTVPLVRVLIQSGPELNASGMPSMPEVMAEFAAATAGTNWPLISPWIGALGAFIAGSNNVSNLMFAAFQFSTGQRIGVDPQSTVVTQSVGAAGGNPIAIHNVITASAAVGLLGREGDLIRKSVVMTLWYCTLAGIVGYIFAFGFGANVGTVLLFVLVTAIAAFVVYARTHENRIIAQVTQPEMNSEKVK